MNQNFTSLQRILHKADFDQAFVSKRVSNKWFTVYLHDSGYDFPRLGMVVSKKIMSKSVARNYTKRLIRETFRINASKLSALDFVVRIKRNMTKESSIEAKEALVMLMLGSNKL